MTLPVEIHQENGRFTAAVLGSSDIRAEAASREEAISAVRAEIDRRRQSGKLVFVFVEPVGVSPFFGMFKDDPTLQELCDEAYRLRDADRPE
jgi:hypothetical protein